MNLLPGLVLVEPEVFLDSRGSFVRRFRNDLVRSDIPVWVESAESNSVCGVVRGLHFQEPPQAKLVWCSRGQIRDVVVDIRRDSPTFGRHVAIELSAANKRQLFIPAGFAHGFSVQSLTATVQYQFDAPHNPLGQKGIAWDDPELAIDWRIRGRAILSDKDRSLPFLRDI